LAADKPDRKPRRPRSQNGQNDASPRPRRTSKRPAIEDLEVEQIDREAAPAQRGNGRAAGGASRQQVRKTERTAKSNSTTVRKAKEAAPSPLMVRLPGLIQQPLALIALAVLLTGGLAYGTTRLQTDASAGLLMDTGSASYDNQVRFAGAFGADPVVVLVQPSKGQQLLTPEHMVGLAQLEGVLARMHGVHKVYGPGTLVNTFAQEVTRRALDLCGGQGQTAEKQAIDAAKAQGKSATDQQTAGQQAFDATVRQCAQQLAAQYPNLSVPALNNPSFYNELLLEPSGSVRPFWRSVLPSPSRALLTVRMDRNASLDDVQAIQHKVDTALGGPKTQMVNASSGQSVSVPTTAGNLSGLRFTVSGTPVLMASLAQSVRSSLRFLLPAALAAMLLLSALVLRVSYRLLAVPLAALAAVWAAGAAALLGLPLTPATLAVLPVVLGLTTDYVLQATNRLAEEKGEAGERIQRMRSAILPATGAAALATAAGVLAFAISTVPLVRQFGLFLALGVAMSWLAALLVGVPVLRLLAQRFPRERPAPSWGLLARAARLPPAALAPLVLAGVGGWVALPFLQVQTDPTRLLPSNSPSLSQAELVYRQVGIAGEFDVVVTGPDVTEPQVVAWMGVTEQRLNGHGLKPLNGLPDFLLAFNYGKAPDPKTTNTILSRLPAYFTGSVVSSNRHLALVTFGQTRVTSVQQDQVLVSRVTASATSAPPGYSAYPAGLSVVAASALDRLSRDQVLVNVAALALVLAVLLAAYRRPLLALLAVLPTVVAAGWITGIAYVLHTQLTPITILLAGVVVAFATEFGVLWLSRYRSELRGGAEPSAAAEVACRRVGPAIVAAAAALVAGFAALAVSPVPMVRDFGLWCAADLALATVAVLVLLPPAARGWLRRP
jgi:predicted RND superfamily exporter protein